MIEARMRYDGKRYRLGTFKTAAEVAAAKVAATHVLVRVEADKPAPAQSHPRPLPGLTTLSKLVDMGVYDRDADNIGVLLLKLKKRYDMVTEGTKSATPPEQTLSLDEMLEVSGGHSI